MIPEKYPCNLRIAFSPMQTSPRTAPWMSSSTPVLTVTPAESAPRIVTPLSTASTWKSPLRTVMSDLLAARMGQVLRAAHGPFARHPHLIVRPRTSEYGPPLLRDRSEKRRELRGESQRSGCSATLGSAVERSG